MIANFSLVNELFRGFYIQRWNDRIRPMELTEMDKHAHKMVIAWVLAKYEEDRGKSPDWDQIIKHGIYELLRRIIISDIKSPIFRKIKKNAEVYKKLNDYVFRQLDPKIESEKLSVELRDYLDEKDNPDKLTTRILDAAHIYASYWEFKIVKASNPDSYQNVRIETELLNDIFNFTDLEGIHRITKRHTISNFIDLIGQLRFQMRWAQIPRVPQTSVLGHTMLVAIISYLFSRENNACAKRRYNSFFGGLFHDLAEAVTRDIISPVKRSSEEFENLLSEIESELAEQEIYPLLPKSWTPELRYFIYKEFRNKILLKGQIVSEKITVESINKNYNDDIFNPYDGQLIRAADHLAAFLEAWNSCESGIKSEDLASAAKNIKAQYINTVIGKVALKNLYSAFKTVC